MSVKSITPEIKAQVEKIVEEFNRKVINNPDIYYIARYKGRFLYLDRFEYDRSGPICRLKYDGDMNNWEFAIFKFSDEKYDPEEYLFPGQKMWMEP